MLQLKKIRKEYKTGDLVQTALNDVSLNLRDSEFVAILGPSGSGKTTLLNIIAAWIGTTAVTLSSTGSPPKSTPTAIGTPTATTPSALCSRATT